LVNAALEVEELAGAVGLARGVLLDALHALVVLEDELGALGPALLLHLPFRILRLLVTPASSGITGLVSASS
jgi:hypothetical protein